MTVSVINHKLCRFHGTIRISRFDLTAQKTADDVQLILLAVQFDAFLRSEQQGFKDIDARLIIRFFDFGGHIVPDQFCDPHRQKDGKIYHIVPVQVKISWQGKPTLPFGNGLRSHTELFRG